MISKNLYTSIYIMYKSQKTYCSIFEIEQKDKTIWNIFQLKIVTTIISVLIAHSLLS